ncbi:MAG: TetR/AcrR family transcriptional regulator [Nitrospinota bacterium]|nr:MAG: TetR/AcrR family transcriptional regulator [Nitrospinota bacterium]
MQTNKKKPTRQRILDAAMDVFAQKGYHATRVDDIVLASQTSKGAVYSYFPSKQQLFLALIDTFVERLEAQLQAAIESEPHGIQRVEAALKACLEMFTRYRKLAKILLIQATGLGNTFEEKRLTIHDRFARLIKHHLDHAVAQGDIPPLQTTVAAYVWMGAIYEVVIRWIYTGQPEPEQALPTLRTMLLRSIGVAEERIQQPDNVTLVSYRREH